MPPISAVRAKASARAIEPLSVHNLEGQCSTTGTDFLAAQAGDHSSSEEEAPM